MKSISITLTISLFLFQFACTMSDNQNCNNESLLNFAVLGVQSKIDACYKSGAQILVSNHKGESIRLVALNNDHDKLAKYFVDVQTKEWQQNKLSLDTASLWDAIEYDNTIIVKHYMDNGFDMKPKYKDGLAPIVHAIFNESNKVVEMLLTNGVDVHFSFDSRPIICIATMFSQMETVELLLNYGANVNDLDGSGVTPLMFAAREGNVEMVRFLLEKGADKSLREIRYHTAYDMVKDNEELKEILDY